MLKSKVVLLESSGDTLMWLEEYLSTDLGANVQATKNELKCYAEKTKDKLWGYFPGTEEKESEKYPQTIALARQISVLIGEDIRQCAFIRLCGGRPETEFGGLHLDTRSKAAEEEGAKRDILRILVNLHKKPRKLRYCPLEAEELRKKDIKVSTHKYTVVTLPDTVKTEIIEIPPLTDNSVYVLKFIATRILHVGVNDEHGHFIASFGRHL
ncbi:hypothetical protein HYZ97_01815 [Candidatus Pacearchaeota archaeon]|nr:hypothetical protein [Candidatus Pacearchaeota archaeon]